MKKKEERKGVSMEEREGGREERRGEEGTEDGTKDSLSERSFPS